MYCYFGIRALPAVGGDSACGHLVQIYDLQKHDAVLPLPLRPLPSPSLSIYHQI
jgi:hypothetical protein